MTTQLLDRLRDLAARLLLTAKRREAEDALRSSEMRRRQTEERLALALDSGEGGIWDWDLSLNQLWISERWLTRLGYVETEPGAHHPIDRILHPADRERATSALFAHLKGLTTTFECEHQIVCSNGGVSWVLTRGRVVQRDTDGRALRVVGTQIDIDQRWKAEQALRTSEARLRLSEERLALALASGEDGLLDNDFARGTNWVSLPWVERLGYSADACDYPVAFWRDAVHPNDAETLARDVAEHFEGRTAVIENEHRLRRADGSYIWTLMRARVSGRSESGAPQRLVGTLIDITRRKKAEARVEYMALHDDLTGLANRRLFRQRLDRAVERAQQGRYAAAVLALDLNGFKAVNDTHGHASGDRLLCAVADRLRRAVRDGDTVARFGGDEFALVLENLAGPDEVEAIARQILALVGASVEIEGARVEVGLCIGAAMVPHETVDADDLLKRADDALYEAKAAGGDAYRLFEPRLAAHRSRRSLLALDMKEAIRRGDFRLVYQPVVQAANGAIVSFEALMRWHHPEHGLISPADFIPIAEETGLIVPLGSWALAEASREAAAWPVHVRVRVAVNVSPVQFGDGLEESVLTALATSGLPASRLQLEVTESALMKDPEAVIATLHRLRALGVRIALDDFGTGYSSLSYLRRFPFDKIKIDRSFIRDITDPDAAAIVRAVVSIGERLGMGIVAEGVETMEQLELVRREGCGEVQGFLFSRPLPAVEALALITTQSS